MWWACCVVWVAGVCRALAVAFEWGYHRWVLHADIAQVRRWRRRPHLLRFAVRAWLAHRAHHARARKFCRARSARSIAVTQRELDHLRKGGTDLILVMVPVAWTPVFGGWFGLGGLAGAVLAAAFHVWIQCTVHPYLHLGVEGVRCAARIMPAWLLRSHWFQRASAHHRGHHHSSRNNFNFLPTADRIFGTWDRSDSIGDRTVSAREVRGA